MNRIKVLIASALLAFTVSGCATTNFPSIGTIISAATVGIDNPVSNEALAGVESSVITARTGAIAYLGLPVCRYGTTTTISNVCSQPNVRRQIKFYNAKVQVALVNARRFVKNNPTVNAASVISLVYQAIDSLNAVKAANGIAN